MRPVAKRKDTIIGLDTHIVLVPSAAGPLPTPMPMPFSGPLSRELSRNVLAEGEPVARVDSVADNVPRHLPLGGSFQKPPSNRARVLSGSARVLVNGKPIARAGDAAECCNDPVDASTGHVIAAGRVLSG
jgi:uncharacterized Zn-binding protein involved in type VI secretion